MSDFAAILSKSVVLPQPAPSAPAPVAFNGAGQLTECNRQWAARPADEKFLSLPSMLDALTLQRQRSREAIVPSRRLTAVPAADNKGLMIAGPTGHEFAPSHSAFGQLATLAGAPAGYLRSLPSPMAADCLNYGLQVERDAQDIGVLLYKNGESILRAATGPKYGRVWNKDIVSGLVEKFGDGVTGRFRVPGVFGKQVPVTADTTTLFAGDRDMFIFLADEENRIEIANRRDGKSGTLARGFFIWNSEVGAATLGFKTFLFDYACSNRIVWGAGNVETIKIRHTASAPDRYIEEILPTLRAYANSSAGNVQSVIAAAQAAKLDKVDEFLAKRFGPRTAPKIAAAHITDENRPIETLWDVTTAATAYARQIEYQNERVELETLAGDVLRMVAA